MNRTARLYAIVEELRAASPGARTASWLADRFEVSVRTIKEVFQAILDHEKKVTAAINAAVKQAQAVDDHSAFEFLQWFVMEQREEIKTFQGVLDRIDLIGDGPQSLYYIDKEVEAIAAASAASSGASSQGAA